MTFYDKINKVWSGLMQPCVLNPEANLGQIILNVLERDPDKIAQISAESGVKLTRRELRLRSIRAAQNLTTMGYKKGDMVTIAAANSENLAPIVFGCFLIGAPINPLAPNFGKDDFSHMMKLTQPTLIFCDENNLNEVQKAAAAVEIEPQIYVFDSTVNVILKETGSEHLYYPKYLGDSKTLLAVILCSSGTTGLPKGVCLSHAHLVPFNTHAVNIDIGVAFNFSPIYWSSGFVTILLGTFNSSIRLISTQTFDENLTFDLIEKYRINMIFMPPAYASSLLKHPRIKEADLSSLKNWSMGGSIVPDHLKHAINNLLPNGRSGVGYGLSELGFIAADFFGQKPNSVGNLIPNMKGKIVDENGNPLDNEEEGEICLKYIYNFLGYYHNEEAFKDIVDEEGWMHTGDIGYFDNEGYLFIVDRKKDIMKYKSFQVSPSDIESVIEKLDGVSQVCVFGRPDETKTSDLVTAVVIKSLGSNIKEKQIIDHVEHNVSDYKKLRGGVFFMEKFPMTPSGKVQRRKIKETILQILNC